MQLANHDGFIFGFSSLTYSLREFHPPPAQLVTLWDAYTENVAPMITIFHRPTIRKLLVEASSHPESLNKNTEAVMFSIYYAAITSMTPSQCLSLLDEEQDTVLTRYHFAVEQAMARANL